MKPEIDNPFYYLDNFEKVLDWIAVRYSDLLDEQEQAFLADFATLPKAARALFVRMVMRKGSIFRASKLSYAEIGSLADAASPLLTLGWVVADPVLTLEQLFELLLKHELAALFQMPQALRNARKDEQLAALLPAYGTARAFSAWCGASEERAYQIMLKPLCDRLRLIFFGNGYQDWSEFVLADLGVFRYEKVDFSPASRGFRSRRDIDDYLRLQQCKENHEAGQPLAAVLAALPAASPENAWLASRRARLLFQFAQQCEKTGALADAMALYEQCHYPGARTRRIRVLEKQDCAGPAFALLKLAMAAPESEAEYQQLLRMAPRLRRRLGHAPQASPVPAPVDELMLALPAPGVPLPVEEVVRAHLTQDQAPVFYVENTLINGLFGLLCWDVVFAAIPGAFFHPFHRGPADLHSADFLQRRAQAFHTCLAELDNDSYAATIRRNFAAKQGLASPFLAWDSLSVPLLECALACIPAAHLKKAFERILQDVKANRSGFPDLVQFWPAERRYRMIEVKGPGDRLQDSQLRWIEYCAAHAMPVAVCYVQWSSA